MQRIFIPMLSFVILGTSLSMVISCDQKSSSHDKKEQILDSINKDIKYLEAELDKDLNQIKEWTNEKKLDFQARIDDAETSLEDLTEDTESVAKEHYYEAKAELERLKRKFNDSIK